MPTMTHRQPSPFPITLTNGRTVTDEVCRCGDLRSEHADTVAYGHGRGRRCEKFTWVAFQYAPAEEAGTR